MQWLSILMLATAVSFDSFAIGTTYGLARIRIPFFARILVSLISATMLLLAMVVGQVLSQWFSTEAADLLGAGILILLGLYTFWRGYQSQDTPEEVGLSTSEPPTQPYLVFNIRIPVMGLMIQVIKQPLAADYDKSKIISFQEAILLGIALALDSLAAGIGAAVLGLSPGYTGGAVVLANLLFLSLGLQGGRVLKEKMKRIPLQWLPGSLIILLGILRIVL